MSRIESTSERITRSQAEVFDFLSIPENYRALMPKQVRSFEADDNSATLDIEGIGKIKLQFSKLQKPTYILMQPVKPVPIEFTIEWEVRSIGEETEVQAFIDAKLNIFMKPIVEPLMRNLLNTQVSKLKEALVQ